MNRREFLRRAISLAPAAIALPTAVTYFLPPRGGWNRYSGFEFIDVETIIKRAFGRDVIRAMDRAAWDQLKELPAVRAGTKFVVTTVPNPERIYVADSDLIRNGLRHLNLIASSWLYG